MGETTGSFGVDAKDWGLFDLGEAVGIVHIGPCGADDEITPPHVLDTRCVCEPEMMDYDNGWSLCIHNDVEVIFDAFSQEDQNKGSDS